MAHEGSVSGPGGSFLSPATGTGGAPSDGVEDLRQRLILALDVDDSVVAMRWAARMRPWFGVAKVGLELFSAAGPPVMAELIEAGFKVFVDMKLADIPTTTRRAARVLGALGASYLTIHTSVGVGTLQAGVEGFDEGAERAGLPAPVALGITILTSEPDAPPELLRDRVAVARDAGCGGLVCAAPDLSVTKAVAPGLLAVVPGIRLAGTGNDDQGRVATPTQALRAGADMLVIGRAVLAAPSPEEAAASILADLGVHLSA
ncbi:MAG TPA: orotidine-5'-phosphate decarboxylase [Acidimicrobiales bacterium]|nr:orotidine-5'-phosphate decarboxylase [Acidimicrobiales bacterium]